MAQSKDKATTTKKARPSGAARKRNRRAKAVVHDNPPLMDVGTSVRMVADRRLTGTVIGVEVGPLLPVLLIRTSDGYEVRFNYDQVEPNA